MTCRTCGSPLAPSATACDNCGTPAAPRRVVIGGSSPTDSSGRPSGPGPTPPLAPNQAPGAGTPAKQFGHRLHGQTGGPVAPSAGASVPAPSPRGPSTPSASAGSAPMDPANLTWLRRVEIDGMVQGAVDTESRDVRTFGGILLRLLILAVLVLVVAKVAGTVLDLAAPVIFTIGIVMFFVAMLVGTNLAKSLGRGAGHAAKGLASVGGRGVAGGGSSAVSGMRTGNATCDVHHLRLRSTDGAVFEAEIIGTLSGGSIRQGDDVVVRGVVARGRVIRVRSVTNVKTGTVVRGRPPLGYVVARALPWAVSVVGIAVLIWLEL